MKLQACAKTDIGLARKNNEDHYFADSEQGLFIVADGMGGHAAGEVASRMAVETVCKALETADPAKPEQLKTAIEEANSVVVQATNDHKEWRGMGTTLTVLLLRRQHAFLAHVGDSRAYRLRDKQLEQLSEDHSLVGEQLRQGIISIDEARSSSLGNILLQAVGISQELNICQKSFPLTQGERFLLCSDGLTDMLTDSEINQVLQSDISLSQVCDELIDMALAAGGKDNITAIVIQIDSL